MGDYPYQYSGGQSGYPPSGYPPSYGSGYPPQPYAPSAQPYPAAPTAHPYHSPHLSPHTSFHSTGEVISAYAKPSQKPQSTPSTPYPASQTAYPPTHAQPYQSHSSHSLQPPLGYPGASPYPEQPAYPHSHTQQPYPPHQAPPAGYPSVPSGYPGAPAYAAQSAYQTHHQPQPPLGYPGAAPPAPPSKPPLGYPVEDPHHQESHGGSGQHQHEAAMEAVLLQLAALMNGGGGEQKPTDPPPATSADESENYVSLDQVLEALDAQVAATEELLTAELSKPEHQQNHSLLGRVLSKQETLLRERAKLVALRDQLVEEAGADNTSPAEPPQGGATANNTTAVAGKITGTSLAVKDPYHAHVLTGSLEMNVSHACDICREEFGYRWRFSCPTCNFDAHMSCLSADMRLPPHLTDARHEHGLVLRPKVSGGTAYTCDVCLEKGHTWVYQCNICSPDFTIHPDCARVNSTCHSGDTPGHWLGLEYVADGLGASCDVPGCPRPRQLDDQATLTCRLDSWTDKPQCPYLAHAACVAHLIAPHDSRGKVAEAMKEGLDANIDKLRGEGQGTSASSGVRAEECDVPSGASLTTEQILASLKDVVGLASVKSFVQSLHAQLLMNKQRAAAGLPAMDTGALHMIFTGNPGTGKTTVARVVAELLKSMGLLKEGHLVEADRSSLVGGYLGQTAIKTKEVFESAVGGVLFVDEAYTLVPTGESDQYGEEALATLMKSMEDSRNEVVVIFAGYREEMDKMLSKNPGVRSRFPTILEFEDYNKDELLSIADGMLKKQQLKLTPGARKALGEELARMAGLPQERKRENGNGRAVRNVVEQAKRRQAMRLVRDPRAKKTAAELQTLTEADFASEGERPLREKLQSPEEVLAKLEAVVGLGSVKSFVRSLQAQLLMNEHRKAAGLPATQSGALHMIFTGNPGTGKTTVARIIAELLRSMGLLRSGHLVEADRSSLVGGFLGQTAIKTHEVIRSALGGVLFVDEAYALAPKNELDNYGEEALATLMKAMEDNRDDLVVILAGYREEMDYMMSKNPGIRSRFPTLLDFEDYSPHELMAIFTAMIHKEGFMLSQRAHTHLWYQLVDMAALPGEKKKENGNGRAVRNIIESAKRKQALRLAHDPTRRTSTDLQTIEDVDLQ